MFNENFTFTSPRADSFDVSNQPSADVSPFTSRCPTPPAYAFRSHKVVRSTRDVRYDSDRHATRPSISSLTEQFESHLLADETESESRSEEGEQDEGYYEGPNTPTTPLFDDTAYSNEYSLLSLDDNADLRNVTSHPRPSLSLEAQAMSPFTLRRRQRQALVRLQCLARRTPDLAILIEECRPNALVEDGEASWTSASSPTSATSSKSPIFSTGRIEKDRRAAVQRFARVRRRSQR